MKRLSPNMRNMAVLIVSGTSLRLKSLRVRVVCGLCNSGFVLHALRLCRVLFGNFRQPKNASTSEFRRNNRNCIAPSYNKRTQNQIIPKSTSQDLLLRKHRDHTL